MTGYGIVKGELPNLQVTVELKSLNGKYLELNLKLPRQYAHKELFIRSECSRLIERGKVSLTITAEPVGEIHPVTINEDLLKAYFRTLERISGELGADRSELLKLALSMPDVGELEGELAPEEEWELVRQLFTRAVEQLTEFRKNEGAELEKDLRLRVRNIGSLLSEVEEADPKRIPAMRRRLSQLINEYISPENIDQNRLEQEMLYYVEKFDITEEKVRLKSHCDYFTATLNEQTSNGKKLGFISQEMGREINTIGSKANDATVQQLVVRMKEELEKIKEQVLNVL